MDVVGTFVGVHDFQIDQVTCDAEFVGDAVTTQHIAGDTGDVQCFAAGVALHDGGDFYSCCAFVFHAA